MTVRKLFFSILTVALLFVATGCDSNDDDDSDADVFVGTWTVQSIADDEGDKTAIFGAGVESFVATLNADGSYTIVVDYNATAEAAGAVDRNLAGSYTVVEAANTVTLSVTSLGASLPLTYDIQNNNTIALTGNADLINLAFGTMTYTGDVVLTITRVS